MASLALPLLRLPVLIRQHHVCVRQFMNRRTGLNRLRFVSSWSMAASVLLAGLGLGGGVGLFAASMIHVRPVFAPVPWNWSVGQDVVGRVISTHEAAWQSSDVPETLPTHGVRVGQQIRLESGLLSLSFRGGARAILNGPAVFEVRSDAAGKLYSGKLSLISPSESGTFVVATPSGRFRCDAGQYGVEVGTPNDAPMTTFPGSVKRFCRRPRRPLYQQLRRARRHQRRRCIRH